MNFYIASSFKNIDNVRNVTQQLKSRGYIQTFDWTVHSGIGTLQELAAIGAKEKEALGTLFLSKMLVWQLTECECAIYPFSCFFGGFRVISVLTFPFDTILARFAANSVFWLRYDQKTRYLNKTEKRKPMTHLSIIGSRFFLRTFRKPDAPMNVDRAR